MLDKLPLALASGFVNKTSGFSQIKEKKSIILLALAKAVRNNFNFYYSAKAFFDFQSFPLAKASGNLWKKSIALLLVRYQLFNIFLFTIVLLSSTAVCFAQTKQLIKRTTYKTDNIEFGVGGTVSIVGAPNGSIVIEGWQKNEVEISAEIEVQAENEADLAQLAAVNTFVLDESFGHIRILTVSTSDKKYMKRVAKKFPKNLLTMPFKIDYHIKVPAFCDLEIDGGNGDLILSGVEGAMRIKVLESNARLNLIGGTVLATFGSGNVDIKIPTRSWRGRDADIQLASGTMNIQLANNLNANVDATVLRSGQIENSFSLLKPRDRKKFTDKLITAKAGNGGATLSFTVGDGTLKLAKIEN